jgi:hypothetical protein
MFFYDEPPSKCFECAQKENRIDDIKYWFRAVLDQLYGLEEFDTDSLERYAGEAAAYLDMKLPNKNLAVVRKNRTVDVQPMLDSWKSANNQYLKSLAKTGT